MRPAMAGVMSPPFPGPPSRRATYLLLLSSVATAATAARFVFFWVNCDNMGVRVASLNEEQRGRRFPDPFSLLILMKKMKGIMQKREGHLNNGFIKEPPRRRIPCPALPCDAMIETDEVDGQQHFARGNLFRADEATDRPLSLFLAKQASEPSLSSLWWAPLFPLSAANAKFYAA